MQTRPVWAEISIERLIHNYRLLRDAAGDAGLIAIVKANAYGHGALTCAGALVRAGAQWLGVTSIEEGVAVRSVCAARGLETHILVMGGVWGEQEAEAAITHGLTPVVWEPVHLEWLEAAAARLGAGPVRVHLEIDTGMSRQGVGVNGVSAILDRLAAAKALLLDGVMTHFHSPEVLDSSSTEAQLERFDSALGMIASRGFHPAMLHAGNSATVLAHESSQGVGALAAKYGASAMLRPGLALYGYAPRFEGAVSESGANALQPVLAWKTRVVSLRTIEPGESAGYCATFHAQRTTRLALLPVGYADGFNRLLSNRGEVLVRGQRAPMVGRVSMDLTIIDVTDVDGVEIGDEVILIGDQRGERITAYELADLEGTIPYEVLCAISARVPRMTVDAGDGHA
jgi:alanine racemase